jgi:hypothetical protein
VAIVVIIVIADQDYIAINSLMVLIAVRPGSGSHALNDSVISFV